MPSLEGPDVTIDLVGNTLVVFKLYGRDIKVAVAVLPFRMLDDTSDGTTFRPIEAITLKHWTATTDREDSADSEINQARERHVGTAPNRSASFPGGPYTESLAKLRRRV